MRKGMTCVLMMIALLTGCSAGEENVTEQLRRQYAAVQAATMEAEIICHYDEEVRTYQLLCAYSPERSTITVLSPENLSGITAQVENGTLKLSYDDISLDAGTYSAAAVSPVVALPKLMEAAAWGYPLEESTEMIGERSCIRLCCDLSGEPGTTYTTWFDEQSLLPLRSEIYVDDVLLFEVAWSRFEVTEIAQSEETDTN